MRNTIRELSRRENRLTPWQWNRKDGKIVPREGNNPPPVSGRFRLKDSEPEQPRDPSSEGHESTPPANPGGLSLKGEKEKRHKQTTSGTTADALVCPKCGHENDAYALRCDACGQILDAGPAAETEAETQPAAPAAAAPPPEATVHEDIRLCPNCGQGSPMSASRCSSCGTVLGMSRLKVISRQDRADGFLGLASVIVAIAGLLLFKFTGLPKLTFGVGIVAAAIGALAFKRDEQPGLALLGIIFAIINVFLAILEPVF